MRPSLGTVVLTSVFVLTATTWSLPAVAQAQVGSTVATGSPSPSPTELPPKPTTKEEALFGKEVTAYDFTRKHISLILGAVLLNPFSFEDVTSMSGAGGPTPAPTPGSGKSFDLKNGDEEVNGFLEIGFRKRWAWLDRESPQVARDRRAKKAAERARTKAAEEPLPPASEDAPPRRTLVALKERADLQRKVVEGREAEYRLGLDDGEANAADAAKEIGSARVKAIAAERERELREKIVEKAGKDAETAARNEGLKEHDAALGAVSAGGCPEQSDCPKVPCEKGASGGCKKPTPCKDEKGAECQKQAACCKRPSRSSGLSKAYWIPDMWHEDGPLGFFLPDDWTVRMGFAFGSDTDLDASSLAGGSDLYSEFSFGYNLINFPIPLNEGVAPASINFELKTDFVTDSDFDDLHERLLIGPAFVFGVPIKYGEVPKKEEAGKAKKKDAEGSGEGGQETKKGDGFTSVVEILVHMGYTNLDVPEFEDGTSRAVRVENEVPDFRRNSGFGLDMEINVPIGKDARAGYLVARGSVNAGFDPNPWTIRLGYSIPIKTFAEALGVPGS